MSPPHVASFRATPSPTESLTDSSTARSKLICRGIWLIMIPRSSGRPTRSAGTITTTDFSVSASRAYPCGSGRDNP